MSDIEATTDGRRAGASDPGEFPRDFGPWRLERELGRGGMGIVYEATDARLDRGSR